MFMKPPRPCFSAKRRTTKNHRPKNTTAGTTHDNRSRRKVLSITRVYGTPYCDRRAAKSGSTRVVTSTVLPWASGRVSLPVRVRSATTTSATRPSARAFSNSL